MKLIWNRTSKLALGLAIAGGVFAVFATDYPMFRGGSGRSGLQTTATPIPTSTPGRTLLRWFDPISGIEQDIDNWEPQVTANAAADWLSPAGDTLAFDFVIKNPQTGRPPYVFAHPKPALSYDNYWTAAQGATPNLDWSFNVGVGDEFQIHVNIPSGPTSVEPLQTADLPPGLAYPQQYYVYEITGVENLDNPGNPYHEKVDSYASGSGYVRLGNGGLTTSKVFKATAANVHVRLIATTPLTSQGLLTDDRPNIVVYADSAKLIKGATQLGNTVASPVAGKLTVTPDNTLYRVLGTRNEDYTVQVGSEIRNYNLGILTSYRWDGLKLTATEAGYGGEFRRNIVWSTPARRPMDGSTAEDTRYEADKRKYILGLDGSNYSRADQNIVLDNKSIGVQVGAGWAVANSGTDFRSDDYLLGAASTAGTSRVYYRPSMPAGSYAVDMWLPAFNALYGKKMQVEIYRGGFLAGTAVVDESAGHGGTPGWVRLKTTTNIQKFDHSDAAPLEVAITNRSSDTNDNGLQAWADAIRFSRSADLSIKSTPIMTRAQVRIGAGLVTKDVAIVARENGQIACYDAQGILGGGNYTGDTTPYWTWPSELPDATDPNKVAGIDGKDGIAMMPTGFDISSALIENVNTGAGNEQLLYITGKNGRVYCIEVAGRGDGTTTRRWSWPDDYPSATPDPTNIGSVTGSLTFIQTSIGGNPTQPAIVVPGPKGRMYCLDAVGTTATRTTTNLWQYPDPAALPLQSIAMTPTTLDVAGDTQIFFGDGQGRFYSISKNDANSDGVAELNWSTTAVASGQAFAPFGASSPVAVPGTYLANGIDTIFVANPNQRCYALNAANGNILWLSGVDDLATSPSGSLGFTFMNTVTPGGNYFYPPLTPPALKHGEPTVVVPGQDGSLTMLYADVARLDPDGSRVANGYLLDGKNTTSVAFAGEVGSFGPPIPQLDEDYNFMYTCDDTGHIYAFGDEPDLGDGQQVLTPGNPPVQEFRGPRQTNVGVFLQDLISKANVNLILPGDYESLQRQSLAGTALAPATINAIFNKLNPIGGGVAARKQYEFGETIYLLVKDLKDFDANRPPVDYQIQVEFNAPGSSSQRRTAAVYRNNARGVGYNNWAIVAIPILGTGTNGLAPGQATMRVSAVVNANGNTTGGNLTIPSARMANGNIFGLNNPIALSRTQKPEPPAWQTDPDSICFTSSSTGAGNVDEPLLRENGNAGGKNVFQGYAMDQNAIYDNNVDEIPHGQTAHSGIFAYDRSAMTLLYGPGRGLQNVKMKPSDLIWNFNGQAPIDTVYKPIDPTNYPGFEELPEPGINVSLDYPDVRRQNISVTKDTFGQVENPLFQAVGLEPPTVLNLAAYKTTTAQYTDRLPRTLNSTEFKLDCDTPSFQPAAKFGYLGDQFLYLEPNTGAASNFGANASFANRWFTSTARIQIDERIHVGNPTIDLGSMPGGGLFGTDNPFNNQQLFADPRFASLQNPIFQTFSIFNEGNVNLLNLRTAKAIQNDPTSLGFGAKQVNSNVFVSNARHLHTDLDPQMTAAGAEYASPDGRRILQKARVGDGEPTRLRLIPVPRGNPNIGVGDTQNVAKLDPRLTVSAPIGTPVGNYVENVYVYEDRNDPGNIFNYVPVLGQETDTTLYPNIVAGTYVPYSDPGMSVRFRVRETRLTTKPTGKAVDMADNLAFPAGHQFYWNNQDPAAFRDAAGNLVTIFSSNRRLSGGGWSSALRQSADAGTEGGFSLYFGSLTGARPNAGPFDSMNSDLEFWNPSTPTRWFIQNGLGYPAGAPDAVFGVSATEAIDPQSVRYGLVAVPTSGAFDALDNFPHGPNQNVLFAFVGEGMNKKSSGESERASRLFMGRLSTAANGSTSVSNPVPLAFNGVAVGGNSKFGKPAIIQTGENATVFYPVTANGLTQIEWANWEGAAWVPAGNANTGSLAIGNGFDSISSVSAVLRRRESDNRPIIHLTFTGKLRGRANSEVFITTLNANNSGHPSRGAGNRFTVSWQTRVEPLTGDTSTGVYWSSGAELRTDNVDVTGISDTVNEFAGLSAPFIDILRRKGNGYVSILDHTTKAWDTAARVITVDTVYGGRAVIDVANGSIQFTGALIPNNMKLFLRATPYYARISSGVGSNFRGLTMCYDDRLQSEPNFSGRAGYIFNGNTYYDSNAVGQTVDRFMISYQATNTSGTANAAPVYRSLRFGAKLAYRPGVNARGYLTYFEVGGMVGGSYYQVDPVKGNVYVGADNELNGGVARTLTVTYDAIDTDGTFIGRRTETLAVGLVAETDEIKVPIENGTNESSVALALDPPTAAFSNATMPRTGLYWLIWTSSRTGSPDVFFQTMAPRFSPDAAP